MQTLSIPTERAASGTRAWKAFLLLLATILAVLHIWALTNWQHYAAPEGRATLVASFGDPVGGGRLPILKIDPSSPLAAVGAKVGDFVVFDRIGDGSRILGANETIGLTFESRNEVRHVFVTPVRDEAVLQKGYFDRYGDFLFWVATAITLAIGVLVGWRNASDKGMRVLSLALMSQCVDFFASRIPGGVIQDWSSAILYPCAYFVAFVGLPYFVLRLPERHPLLRATFVRVLFFLYAAGWFLVAANLSMERFGAHRWYVLPSTTSMGNALEICCAFIASIACALAWRRSVGPERQRAAWIGVCVCGVYLAIAVPDMISVSGLIAPSWTRGAVYGIWFVSSCGLAYATLRHRLFDFGFAVNRAAVYTGTTALLLVAFGLFEWAAEHLLQFEGRDKSMILDAGLALGVFLAFHRVRDLVEHWVERILFREWHDREASLRLFVRRAAHVTAEVPLIDSFVDALAAFTGGSSCAVYLRSFDGNFALKYGSLAGAPTALDQNAPGVLALRESHIPVRNEEGLFPDGTLLALPMSHRGVLNGFVLLTTKPNGDSYRPDEIIVLDFAVSQIGLDLHALRVEALRTEVDAQRARAERLQARNEALEFAICSGSPDPV